MIRRAIAIALVAGTCAAQDWHTLGALWNEPVVSSSYTPPGYSQSLLWYKFSGTVDTNNIVDSSPSGNNGFLVMSSSAATNYSFADSAFQPDPNASDAYAYIQTYSNSFTLGSTNTFAAWVYLTGRQSGGYEGILFSRLPYSLGLNVYDPTSQNYGCYYGAVASVSANNAVTSNSWVRIVAVKTGARGIYYVNGVASKTNSTLGTTSLTATNAFRVGIDVSGNRVFRGKLDDVYLTTYPFTASDVLSDYNAQRSP